jgi:hypothetical protein
VPRPANRSTLPVAYADTTRSIVSPGLNQIENHGERRRRSSGADVIGPS